MANNDQQPPVATGGLREVGRLEAFSDGVIGIAMTLLVLELKFPASETLGEGSLLAALIARWPSYLAFLTSFTVIGIMWINHHNMLRNFAYVDQGALMVNLALLLGFTLVPFPTTMIADYIQHPEGRTAAVVMGLLFFYIAIVYNGMWWYMISRPKLHAPDIDLKTIQNIGKRYRFGPYYYLGTVVIGLFSPVLSLITQFILAIYFVIPIRTSDSV